jgi:HlyD family secretion protein
MEQVKSQLGTRACWRTATGSAALACAWLLGAGLWVAGCSSKEEPEAQPNVTVQAATVETQTVQSKIETSAILYPRDEAAIVPKVTAPVKKFYVDRGSKVHAGQLLAELDNRDLEGAVRENQGAYAEAQEDYNNALEKAKQDLAVAKQELDAARNLYNSRQTLFQQGAIAGKDVEDAKTALTQAQSQYALAEKDYSVKAAAAAVAAARGRETSAEAQLSYTRITSPIDGVVTDRPYYAGETPASGAPLVTVMDLSSVVARAYLSPQQAGQLHVGDAASLTPGEGQTPVPGKVTVISPALDANSTTLEVWVTAANPGEKLKPGASVTLDIVVKTVKNALVVPAAAILTATDGSTSVMVIGGDGKAHQTTVKTGIRDGDAVQILSGLEAGQQVVTTGAYGLPDGTKVTVQKAADSGGSEPD